MPLDKIFPVTIFKDYLYNIDNEDLIKVCDQIKEIDKEGRATSFRRYQLGYSSYYTIDNLHELAEHDTDPYNKLSPLFAEVLKRSDFYANNVILENNKVNDQLPRHRARETFIQSCWVNITEQYHYHEIHNHTGSLISGIYYLNDSSSITFYNMNQYIQDTITYDNKAGLLLLWPGWLYHQADQIMKKESKYGITFNISCEGWGNEKI
tara:strand:- start:673 stop:1296 length:624 start_codon:yes stop_codon:yes gene_type:complete